MLQIHVNIADDLADAVEQTWPDSSWNEVITYALALLIGHAVIVTDQPSTP